MFIFCIITEWGVKVSCESLISIIYIFKLEGEGYPNNTLKLFLELLNAFAGGQESVKLTF